MKLFRRVIRHVGSSPGSVIPSVEPREEPIRIQVLDWTETSFEEKTVTLEECFKYTDPSSLTWIDISGIHELEAIVRTYRELGGDVYMMRTQDMILDKLKSAGFYDFLGEDHFLTYNGAIEHLFHRVLDPAVCIYECEARVFLECQNLPRPSRHAVELEAPHIAMPTHQVKSVEAKILWDELHKPNPPMVIDVRESREFHQGHIPQARLIPLNKLFGDISQVPKDKPVVFVCRSGRRSTRATFALANQGYENVRVLRGGILAWEAAGFLEAVDR